jgi:hypothetical protein
MKKSISCDPILDHKREFVLEKFSYKTIIAHLISILVVSTRNIETVGGVA